MGPIAGLELDHLNAFRGFGRQPGQQMMFGPPQGRLGLRHDEAAAKAEAAGFEVEYLSHFMATIFPLVWLKRRLSNLFSRTETLSARRKRRLLEREMTIVPGVNGLLARLLSHEVRAIARRKTFRYGTSLILVGRKKAAA